MQLFIALLILLSGFVFAGETAERDFAVRLHSVAAKREAAPEILNEVKSPPRGSRARREKFISLLEQSGAVPGDIKVERVYNAAPEEKNTVITIPGSDPDAGYIVIGAHTDSTSDSAGAIDDWSGTVMLAALYQRFASRSTTHGLIFIGFASEEHGGQGSRQFVRYCGREVRSKIRAMVNLECLGVGLPRVWLNSSSDNLEKIFIKTGRQERVPIRKQILFGYTSDADSFAQAGIPSVTIHSLSPDNLSVINGPSDTPDKISMPRYRMTFRVLSAYLERLDESASKPDAYDSHKPLQSISSNLLRESGNASDGVLVKSLEKNSPEKDAGIIPGDVITYMNSSRVRTRQELLPVLLTLWKGREVPVTVRRKVGDGVAEINLVVQY